MNYRKLIDEVEQSGSFHISNFMMIALDLECRSDALREIIESLDNENFEQLFPDIVAKDWYKGIEDVNMDDRIQLLLDFDKLGFIAEIGVHHKSNFTFRENDSFSSCSIHQGMSYVKYAYGDTIEELLNNIRAHCDEMEQYDIKKEKEK